jgi:hypothetical protein
MSPELLSFLTSPHFNPNALYGLAGIPTLESFINYLKNQWGLPPDLAAFATLVCALILNVWLGVMLGVDLKSSIISGLVTAVGTNTWYEFSKEPKVIKPQ